MPMTLADAQQLTQSTLIRGIIQVIITESAVLRYLPFVNINGDGLSYNKEATLPTATFFAPLDTWTESVVDIATIVTDQLTIISDDADIDNFYADVFSDKQDLTALTIEEQAKAIAYKYNDGFFNGDGTSNAFKGLHKKATDVNAAVTTMVFDATHRLSSNGANGAALSLSDMDVLIDAIKPGKPDALFMSKRSRRSLKALKRASGGGVVETTTDAFGRQVQSYDDIPLLVDDNIADTYTVGSSTTTSRIYAVKFGFRTGILGIQNGGIRVVPIGNLETKDAIRRRIKWYSGLTHFGAVWSFAELQGVLP